ncbi:MAG: hypothetical protein IPG50_30870 [Myxococcales bacterium]|nr:hypothetical protein [Myxococcales bacterium]
MNWFWVNRSASGTDHDISYPGYAPAGYAVEGPVFAAADVGGVGMHALYNCQMGANRFVSPSSTCEGQTRVSASPIGYVFTQAAAGRTPIYRCNYAGDHFVSTSATCEVGVSPEGVLGYF